MQWPQSTGVPPKHVYVEGVTPGDTGTVMLLTLLLDDTNLEPVADKFFGEKACWDALMLSVKGSGVPKPYVDRSPVWLHSGSSSFK